MRTLLLITAVLTLNLAGATVARSQPTQVSYQGELLRDNEPFSGEAQFKFAIRRIFAQNLWSNDGTASGQPSTPVLVQVENGIFNVLLGGPGMEAIDPAALRGQVVPAPRLLVWVNTGDGWEQLTDQPLASAAWSLATEFGRSIRLTNESNSGHVFLVVDADLGGEIQLRNTEGIPTLQIRSEEEPGDGSGFMSLWSDQMASNPTVSIDADEGGGAIMRIRDTDGVTAIVLDAKDGSNAGGQVTIRNSLRENAIVLDAARSSDGASIIRTDVVQIRGADVSEQFEVWNGGADVKPGMVVVIDRAEPGRLSVSHRAYDHCVAGIVSGAGGVRPGMLMGQENTVADGPHPVALTGRVYCWADASHGAIAPGDLLTTSDTPGHAQKATDHDRARGATIGKAMTGLDRGKGLVLVLVALQ